MSEPAQELAVIEQVGGGTIVPLEDPAGFVAGYVAVANELSRVVRGKELFKRIGDKDHVLVEGWTLLGSMLGVFPVTVWSRPVLNADGVQHGWEARVEARTRDGGVVGAAEAECLRTESLWKNRDDYALRSMAQTRATSKALRQPLGFVMTLAGFNATPAEEIPADGGSAKPTKKQLDYLRTLLRNGGYDTEHVAGVPLSDLSRSEASDYIEQLRGGGEVIEAAVIDDDEIPF